MWKKTARKMLDYLSCFEEFPMAFTPYPIAISPDTWEIVLNAFRGQLPDPKVAAHALWDTAGFALGKVYPDGHPVMFSPAPLTAADRTEVEQCLTKLASPGMKADAALPWGKILVTLAQLLAQILAGG